MLIKIIASFLLAISTLSYNSTVSSPDLVITTFAPRTLSSLARFLAMAKFISFSLSRKHPKAPISLPPCPASTTILTFFKGLSDDISGNFLIFKTKLFPSYLPLYPISFCFNGKVNVKVLSVLSSTP